MGTGYSGEATARFPGKTGLRRVFVILHRYPVIPEDGDLSATDYGRDENYQEWWGYLRYDAEGNGPPINEPQPGDVLIIEPDERLPLYPRSGWPGGPLPVEVISPHPRDEGFETLVSEYAEADG